MAPAASAQVRFLGAIINYLVSLYPGGRETILELATPPSSPGPLSSRWSLFWPAQSEDLVTCLGHTRNDKENCDLRMRGLTLLKTTRRCHASCLCFYLTRHTSHSNQQGMQNEHPVQTDAEDNNDSDGKHYLDARP